MSSPSIMRMRSPMTDPSEKPFATERMIRIADVTTKQTVDVALEQRGMESVQCLMEQACSAFGVPRILRLVVGDLVISQDNWTRHSVDTYMLLGEPWMVKCFVEYKSNGPIVVDFEGETTTLDLGPQDPLGDLVYMMFLEKGIPPEDLRLFHNQEPLFGSDTPLTTWGVEAYSTVHAFRRMSGGGGPIRLGVPLSFVNISDHSLPTRREWGATSPSWRIAHHGLCIDGLCTNPTCKSKGNRVIVNFGYTTLSLVEDVHLCCCPVCESHVEPVTCGFNNCYWSLWGRKRNTPSEPPTTVKITEKYADDAWHCYDPSQNGTAQWLALIITARERSQRHCWECCSFIDGARETMLPNCGHSFHSYCIDESGVCQRCQTTLTAFQRIRSAV